MPQNVDFLIKKWSQYHKEILRWKPAESYEFRRKQEKLSESHTILQALELYRKKDNVETLAQLLKEYFLQHSPGVDTQKLHALYDLLMEIEQHPEEVKKTPIGVNASELELAVKVLKEHQGIPSPSFLQRALSKESGNFFSYEKTEAIMEKLTEKGILGEPDGRGGRKLTL